ncbi:MAG: hypothetical protein KAX05_02865 [Bacteroidales bacterium]|nr:hypothetical protein [Bacteroidales bacterium]
MKNIEPAKLNKLRLLTLIVAFIFLAVTDIFFYTDLFPNLQVGLENTVFVPYLFLITLILFKRETVSRNFKKVLISLVCISGLVVLYFNYSKIYNELPYSLYWIITDVSKITLISVSILFYFLYLHKTDIFIPGLIMVILVGLFLNRIGLEYEAIILLLFGFGLFSVSLIYVSIRSLRDFLDNKFVGRLFFSIGVILAFCNATFFIKFSMYEAAYISTIDFFGAIFFLIACLLLFAFMPFSNFIEWSKRQKRLFYRLFLIPMIFLLLLFSLKFLLPGTTYQKLFFKGYAEKEKTYFGMDDYKIKKAEEEKKH